MKLSLKDRLILRNQYIAIANITNNNIENQITAKDCERAIEILEQGFELDYENILFQDITTDTVSSQECYFVDEVLWMYTILQNLDKTILFKGFDTLSDPESRCRCYMKHLLKYKWSNILPRNGNFISSGNNIAKYERMLAKWKSLKILPGYNHHTITKQEIQDILNA